MIASASASMSVVRSTLGLAAALGIALGSDGCASKASPPVQTYTLDPPVPSVAVDRAGAVVVSLARVRVAPPYAGTSFVYRMGGHRIERDPYAAFAAPPGWMLTSAIRGYIRHADFIRDVVEPGSEVPVVLLIEAEANELCADLPEGGEATAKLTLQFRVFAPASGTTPERELLRKTYARSQPLAARDSAAIAEAWNRELSEIADAFLADLRPLLPPVP